MKRLLMTAAALALLTTAAHALPPDFTASEIAMLPQDKVAAIKMHCSRWGSRGDFDKQKHCENEQFNALRMLIARDSVKGDKL